MSLPTRIAAYDDCFEVFARALADRGGRVAFKTYAEANFFMLRLHQARSLERDQNKRLYPINSPKWGYSEYDKLMVRSPRKSDEPDNETGDHIWWIYLEIPGANIIDYEPIKQYNEFNPELIKTEAPMLIEHDKTITPDLPD